MAEQHHPDDLAQLRARLDIQEAEIARLKRRHRFPRRFLPLALVGLLVALLPLSILAAGPVFSDLSVAAPVHQPNIQAIADAGITTGFADPNDPSKRVYDPKANVTREEMASFLARTAGLDGNPPVVNAQTAQTAANATAFGGKTPGDYLPSSGDVVLWYSAQPLAARYANAGTTFTDITFTDGPATILSGAPAGGGQGSASIIVQLSLPRPTALLGTGLGVKAVQICYRRAGSAAITATSLAYGATGTATTFAADTTARTSTTASCYSLSPATPTSADGALYASLAMTLGSGSQFTLYSARLTLGTP